MCAVGCTSLRPDLGRVECAGPLHRNCSDTASAGVHAWRRVGTNHYLSRAGVYKGLYLKVSI